MIHEALIWLCCAVELIGAVLIVACLLAALLVMGGVFDDVTLGWRVTTSRRLRDHDEKDADQ